MNGFPWLSLLILVPLVGAVVVALLPRTSRDLVKQTGVGISLVTLALALGAASQYTLGGGMQLEEQHAWVKPLGVHYALGVDGRKRVDHPAAVAALQRRHQQLSQEERTEHVCGEGQLEALGG